MSSHTAIVDDHDPVIRQTGTWVASGSQEEFRGTTSCSAVKGSTAQLTFVGTEVNVYGSVSNNSQLAALSFSVDSGSATTYRAPSNMTSPVHHQLFWSSGSLGSSDGKHNLTITQSAADPACNLYIDFITYTTTQGSGNGGPSAYFIDDRDQGIEYDPAWVQYGSDPDFMHTSQATTSGTMKYVFEGVGISYFGGLLAANNYQTNASISIDGGPSTIYVGGGTDATNNLYFTSGALAENAQHTLEVTALNGASVWIDYLLVSPAANGASGSGSSPASGSSGGSSKFPVGPVVGAIVGGLAFFAFVIAGMLFFLRRRNIRRRERRRSNGPDMTQYVHGLNSPFPGAPTATVIAAAIAGRPDAITPFVAAEGNPRQTKMAEYRPPSSSSTLAVPPATADSGRQAVLAPLRVGLLPPGAIVPAVIAVNGDGSATSASGSPDMTRPRTSDSSPLNAPSALDSSPQTTNGGVGTPLTSAASAHPSGGPLPDVARKLASEERLRLEEAQQLGAPVAGASGVEVAPPTYAA
ncbi:hypothetical protein HMN09_00376800 [Mycena chlorophos]|uniref:Transmembrane protein n=1 Tax=Mycena chlorophos TaxID=658473 RepID=A0A8H6TL27_MYCCL|nr:hypothetical protein HMN09_00376800 [Mycena chlorophos]